MLEDHTAAPTSSGAGFPPGFLLGSRVRPLRPRAVTLLLEVAMLRGVLGIDLTLDGIGPFLLFFLRGALTRARGRARRIGLRLGRSLIRTGTGLCLVGSLVASGGRHKHGDQNENLQAHSFLLDG